MLIPMPTANQGTHPPCVKNYRGEPSLQIATPEGIFPSSAVVPQGCGCEGGTGQGNGYIYAMGEIEPIFPSLSVEKEFYQALDHDDMNKPITRELLYSVFKKIEAISKQGSEPNEGVNLYIARQMVWIFKIAGLEVYILKPDTDETLYDLVDSLASEQSATAPRIIIGSKLPITGEMPVGDVYLPVVICNHTFSFDKLSMENGIKDAAAKLNITPPTTEETDALLAGPMMELVGNQGAGDPERALNFALLQCPGTYAALWQMVKGGTTIGPKDASGFSLLDAQAVPSAVQGSGITYDVIFSFRGNSSNIPVKLYCRIDTKGVYPYLVSGMARFYG